MWRRLVDNSLWLIGLGLMLASSGIDGAYMAQWMGPLAGLGYVLNTTADVAGMVLTYFYGRLRQDRSSNKRKWAGFILVAEFVAVAYSWFFSWRQLRMVLVGVEGSDARWVAPIAAGFIPLLLGFVGYAESLIVGRFDEQTMGQTTEHTEGRTNRAEFRTERAKGARVILSLPQFRAEVARLNGDLETLARELSQAGTNRADVLNDWLEARGYARKAESTARDWARVVEQAVEAHGDNHG